MKLFVKFFSVFLLALMITACSSQEEGPEAAAKEFISAMYKGDIDKVTGLLYFPEEKGASDMISVEGMVKSKMKMAIDQAVDYGKGHGGVDKIECTLVNYTNEEKTEAKVLATTYFKDGTKDEVHGATTVIKVNGKWLVAFKI